VSWPIVRGKVVQAKPAGARPNLAECEWVLTTTYESAVAVSKLLGILEQELMLATAERESDIAVRFGMAQRADGLLVIPVDVLNTQLRSVSHAAWERTRNLANQTETELRNLATSLQVQFRAKMQEAEVAIAERNRFIEYKNEQRLENARRSSLVAAQSSVVRAKLEVKSELSALRAENEQLRAKLAEREMRDEAAAKRANGGGGDFLVSLSLAEMGSGDDEEVEALRADLISARVQLIEERRLQVSLHEKVGQLTTNFKKREVVTKATRDESATLQTEVEKLRTKTAELEQTTSKQALETAELRVKTNEIFADKIELRAKLHAAMERLGVFEGATSLSDIVAEAVSASSAPYADLGNRVTNAPAVPRLATSVLEGLAKARALNSRIATTQTSAGMWGDRRSSNSSFPSRSRSNSFSAFEGSPAELVMSNSMRELPMGSALSGSLAKRVLAANAKSPAAKSPSLASSPPTASKSREATTSPLPGERDVTRQPPKMMIGRASSPMNMPRQDELDESKESWPQFSVEVAHVGIQVDANQLDALRRAQEQGRAFTIQRDAAIAFEIASVEFRQSEAVRLNELQTRAVCRTHLLRPQIASCLFRTARGARHAHCGGATSRSERHSHARSRLGRRAGALTAPSYADA